MGREAVTVDEALKFFELDRNTSLEVLSKKHKMLSKRYHPDFNDGKKETLDIFHSVQENYEFLKAALFSEVKPKRTGRQKIYTFPIPISTMLSGGDFEDFEAQCCQCNGHGVVEIRTCPVCEGLGGHDRMVGMLSTRDVCSRCGGAGEIEIICGDCNKGRRHFPFRISIPARSRPGDVIYVDGCIIELCLDDSKPSRFSIDGTDLRTTAYLPYTSFIYGAKRNKRLPNGHVVFYEIPPFTKPGSEISIPKAGLSGPNGIGAVVVTIMPTLPDAKKLTGMVSWCMKRLNKAGF